MEKTDLQKQYKSYYSAHSEPHLVEFSKVCYLSITGEGDPSGQPFAQNIHALYTTAYALKFQSKSRGNDFVVAKLEALWWYDENQYKNVYSLDTASLIPREDWKYRLLIRIPDFIESCDLEDLRANLTKKSALTQKVNLYELSEGLTVQILHNGPFSDEPKTLAKINRFMADHQLEKAGYHHEIYLSDFRKTAPEKLRTILREPVKAS